MGLQQHMGLGAQTLGVLPCLGRGLQLGMFQPCPSPCQAFDQAELLECICQLISIDQDWVPCSDSASLYIRPTFIGTEVPKPQLRGGR